MTWFLCNFAWLAVGAAAASAFWQRKLHAVERFNDVISQIGYAQGYADGRRGPERIHAVGVDAVERALAEWQA